MRIFLALLMVNAAIAQPLHPNAPAGWHNYAVQVGDFLQPAKLQQRLDDVAGDITKPSWFDKQATRDNKTQRRLIYARYVRQNRFNLRAADWLTRGYYLDSDLWRLAQLYDRTLNVRYLPRRYENTQSLSPSWQMLVFNDKQLALMPFKLVGPILPVDKHRNPLRETEQQKLDDDLFKTLRIQEQRTNADESMHSYGLYRLPTKDSWQAVVILEPDWLTRLDATKATVASKVIRYPIETKSESGSWQASNSFTILDIDGDGAAEVIRVETSYFLEDDEVHSEGKDRRMFVRRNGHWWLTNDLACRGDVTEDTMPVTCGF